MAFVNDADRASYCLYTDNANTPDTGPLNTNIKDYASVNYVDYSGGIPLCIVPTINNFTSPIRAGVDEILIIQGSHFGSTRGNGSVQLKDANDQGIGYLQLDDIDYVQWSDTEIRIKVPGIVVRGSNYTAQLPKVGCPGSGSVKVINNNGEFGTSTSELDIEYAARQYINSANGVATSKERYFFAKNNCADGYTFRLENTLKNDVNAVKAIEAALATWSTKLGIYLALERDAQNQPVGQANASASADGVNMIYFDVFTGADAATLMRTSANSYQACGSGATTIRAVTDVDIAVNVNPSAGPWDYNLSGNVQGYDFYTALLHELGHALRLGHVVTPNIPVNQQLELMYAREGTNPTAAMRKTLETGRGKSFAGAVAIRDASLTKTWCVSSLSTLLRSCLS